MAKSGVKVETPLMKQYYSIKEKHPDAILLFRVGDFYETFGDDAIKASKILGITLTQRANGAATYVDLAGFPYHAVDTYLPKLVRAGQRVAICEQLEDPKMTKKIVKRGVTELVTPGVSINDNVLETNQNNFLASVHIHKDYCGVAFLDISTGEFYVAEGNVQYVDKLLQSFQPKEILHERSKSKDFLYNFGDKHYTYKLEDWAFNYDNSLDKLLKHFKTKSLKGFGIQKYKFAIIAAGSILSYLDITEHKMINHISSISRIEEENFVWLDKFTVRNLELLSSINEGAKTLVDVIDRTISPMGSRLLKRWITLPLKHSEKIAERHQIVDYFLGNIDDKVNTESEIRKIGDLERIISKVAVNRILPRELVQLKKALQAINPIKELCEKSDNETLKRLSEQLNLCNSVIEKIENEIKEEPSNNVNKGNVIADGVSKELDDLRKISQSGKTYLAEMQIREEKRTGIPKIKISFNNVFGYFIEVRNAHKDKVPEEWIRKQTLVSAERYITEELKEYETKILGAEEKISSLELKIYNALVISIMDFITTIQVNASVIAQLDCLLSFSTIAEKNNYTKPNINDSDVLDIKQGRHPVIETQMEDGEPYIPNDIYLDKEKQQIIIITGPNMAGKSALLRQTALIVLLAQIGSFVPADKADIGIVDKIFTRVGASDNISSGESTFMVEMTESASILNNISDKSLVLLDEIGRGTSTYDGLSIAWAITEFIHEHPKAKAKTLFATHYHELNEIEKTFNRVKNYHVTIKELKNKVIFLRKLERGGTEHSFGIHVAEMAGMPKSVVKRAKNILKDLEKSTSNNSIEKNVDEIAANREGYQLSFFQLDDPVLSQIKEDILNLEIDNLTPMEALNKLNDIKKLIT